MKPTQEQILSALNKLVRENKTELKAEKIELGSIDDLAKYNSEARKLIESLDKENRILGEEYQELKNKARAYNKVNKSYRDSVKKGKVVFKNLKNSVNEVDKAVRELGLKPNDVPEFKNANRALEVIRAATNDGVNYPDIEI
tara:strand:+ start:377 stop:802 length:426 start_codon:yes stop_codon:yes gene_type:complete